MANLFRPYHIGSMRIRNRFLRSATTSYWSDEEGTVRPEIIELYRNLTEGEVGLIVKGHLYVADAGKAHPGMAGISREKPVAKLKALTEAVHGKGGKIVAQLNHAGVHSIIDRAGPSEYSGEGWTARAMTEEEIHRTIQAFGEAAERAIGAGFDGVQIHGAHGYLISQFLSRFVNHRQDKWGGSLSNRMRLLLSIYDETRRRLGSDVPVLLKMNCDDFSPNGFTIDDSLKVAENICKRGLDILEISGGGIGRRQDLRDRARSEDPDLAEAPFAGFAERIRKVTRPTPLALVNGIRSLRCMETIIQQDIADLISMSRPFIREPDLVKRLKTGHPEATCTTCGLCQSPDVFSKMMLRCHLARAND